MSDFPSLARMDRLNAVCSALEDAESLIITCHVRPDGDAIGSMLGMAAALEAAGKYVICYCQDAPPQTLGFLPGFEKIVHTIIEPFPEETSLLVLDCSEADRIGENGSRLVEAASRLIVVDHHLGQDMCGDRNKDASSTRSTSESLCVQYINPDIFATGAICFAIVENMGLPVTPEIATNFYAAILTDTGSFCHSNTTALAFEMAARLVEYGADPYDISDRIFERVPFRKLSLLNLALDTLRLELSGRMAVIHVTRQMLEETQTTLRDCDDFVRYARCIDGVEVSVFIKEVSDGMVSVSLRSRSWFNVAALAKEFGGGGHFHAAGFRANGSAEEWRERLKGLISKGFSREDSSEHGGGGAHL